ncbi:MAG: ribonuclease J [Bacilli bacterium]|nr:ribonuclease J [Bacilli bacterium]
MKENERDAVSVFALGGLGEVGKNMYVVKNDKEIIIIDAGVMFPEDDLLGVDYVIQDISYLKENESKIVGLFITHGHEDHIGGIPFLLGSVKIPKIYTSKIANDLILKKLVDRNIKFEDIEVFDENSVFKFKTMNVDFIRTSHSIPDSYAIAIHTKHGVIITTGDFKFDLTPIGPMSDLHKMARLGEEGVKLLMSDSTNAMSEGFSKSESCVDETISSIFTKYTSNRIILATFASNIYRIKHIVETCRENGRKIVTFGRSMENAKDIALKNNLITDKTIFIEANEAKNLKKNEICILCTGSQGEPLAALSRIANGTHKQITLLPDDIVVFSSNPIPGKATGINRIINKLYLKGVKVVTNTELTNIHTSGHAKQEELRLMLRLIKPEYFMPVHGEYRMLKEHKNLAISCDIPEDKIFILKNGESVELSKEGVKRGKNYQAGDVYVDGSRIGSVGSVVLKDRKLMSKDGILVAILNLDVAKKELLIHPNVTTRGFILVNENADLILSISRRIESTVKKYFQANAKYNYVDLKNQIILDLNPYIIELTGRRPIILPVVMEIK